MFRTSSDHPIHDASVVRQMRMRGLAAALLTAVVALFPACSETTPNPVQPSAIAPVITPAIAPAIAGVSARAPRLVDRHRRQSWPSELAGLLLVRGPPHDQPRAICRNSGSQ